MDDPNGNIRVKVVESFDLNTPSAVQVEGEDPWTQTSYAETFTSVEAARNYLQLNHPGWAGELDSALSALVASSPRTVTDPAFPRSSGNIELGQLYTPRSPASSAPLVQPRQDLRPLATAPETSAPAPSKPNPSVPVASPRARANTTSPDNNRPERQDSLGEAIKQGASGLLNVYRAAHEGETAGGIEFAGETVESIPILGKTAVVGNLFVNPGSLPFLPLTYLASKVNDPILFAAGGYIKGLASDMLNDAAAANELAARTASFVGYAGATVVSSMAGGGEGVEFSAGVRALASRLARPFARAAAPWGLSAMLRAATPELMTGPAKAVVPMVGERGTVMLSGKLASVAPLAKELGTVKASDFFSRKLISGTPTAISFREVAAARLEAGVGYLAEEAGFRVIDASVKFGPRGAIGEIDIETETAIIEVTLEKSEKLAQVKKLLTNADINPTRKPVILFAPNYGGTAGKDITKAGAMLARTQEELLQALQAL